MKQKANNELYQNRKKANRKSSIRKLKNRKIKKHIDLVEKELREMGIDEIDLSYEKALVAEKILRDRGLPYKIIGGAMADDTVSFGLENHAFPYFWVTSEDYVLDFNAGIYRAKVDLHTDRETWLKKSKKDSNPLYEEYIESGITFICKHETNLIERHIAEALVKVFSCPNCQLDRDAVEALKRMGLLIDSDVEEIFEVETE